MRRFLVILSIVLLSGSCKSINEPLKQVVFYGDSHVRNWDLDYWFPYNYNINNGIPGYKAVDLINDIDETDSPEIRVVWIGINDIIQLSQVYDRQTTIDSLLDSFALLSVHLDPDDILISVCPVTETFDNLYNQSLNSIVSEVNTGLKILCSSNNLEFVDFSRLLVSGDVLKEEYTQDGLHLNNRGYGIISKRLRSSIY